MHVHGTYAYRKEFICVTQFVYTLMPKEKEKQKKNSKINNGAEFLSTLSDILIFFGCACLAQACHTLFVKLLLNFFQGYKMDPLLLVN